MIRTFRHIPLLFFIFIAGCERHEPGVMKFQDGQVQHVVRHGDVEWVKCPPQLPAGCELSVLEGNPKGADFFTVRFKLGKTFVMSPHTHPKDERVTIIEGDVSVAFGMNAKHEDATRFKAGDYYVNARNSIHTVWIDSPSIIQISGIGPWEADFVEKK